MTVAILIFINLWRVSRRSLHHRNSSHMGCEMKMLRRFGLRSFGLYRYIKENVEPWKLESLDAALKGDVEVITHA